ncbi:MAG: anaerobic ribonucleoside-triphosphate reductase activating protein [Bacilli bacterium]
MEFVGIDKFSLLDYDNYISVVLFAPKCNFRCPFCHNGTTVLESHNSISFDEIVQFLQTRKGLVDAVVFTGGEPTLMPELKKRIETVKNLGFLIKLDTNGTNYSVLKDLLDSHLIDYVAMDIKNSFKCYPETCGVDDFRQKNIEKSINLLRKNVVNYEFRTTLVNEYHNEDSIIEMGKLLDGAHNLYLQKFVDREGVIKKGLHEVSYKKAIIFQKLLQKYIKDVKLRGY